MPRLRCFAGLFLVALFADWRLAPAIEPRNLITNGGFEDGVAGWVADRQQTVTTAPGAAHSGKACLTGEITKLNQALILRRYVQVKAGHHYEFQAAARVTRGTKLVLWAVLPGEKQKTMIEGWNKLTAKWQEVGADIHPKQDGTLELQIVAPSSFGAPPGRIWIDDVKLQESPVSGTSLTHGEGFNDEPGLARADDGSFYAAWISFRDGADTLQVARYQPGDSPSPHGDGSEVRPFKPLGQWQLMGGRGIYLLGVSVVAAGDRVAVVYAAEQNHNWDIYVSWCGTEGPSPPMKITDDAAADLNPAAAWHSGTLWLAWESNREGVHRILATSIHDGRVAKPELLGPADANAYDPSLAVLQNGVVCVAWHSFIDDNYDVYLSRRAAAGGWSGPLRLTHAPTIDRHAVLLARGDELWVAYENAQVKQYHVGATNFRRLIVGRLDGDKLLVPKDYRRSPLWGRCEAPSLAFDTSGRLWVAYLRPRMTPAGWDCMLTSYDGAAWQAPLRVSWRKGMDRRPNLVIDGTQAFIASQSDDMPLGWTDIADTTRGQSDVTLAVAPLGAGENAAAMQLEPLVEPDEGFEAAALHRARGEHLPTPAIQYQGQTLKLYFGDLHHHSDISRCNRCGDQSVEEGYQHMRDINRLDFACSTDHCYNLNAYLWNYLGKMARANEQPGHFLPFLSEEWTSTFKETDAEHPFGFYGHRNLIFSDTYFPRWWNAQNRQTPAEVWEELRALHADFIHIPHQLADTGNVPTDWKFTDRAAQPVAEIFQTRGAYECHGGPRQADKTTGPGWFIQDAWARGIVIGVIAAPDHGGGYGKACVYAPEFSRKAILEAIRQRHCYGTTAAKIFLDVRVADHLMGDVVPELPGGPVTVTIHAVGPTDIDRVEVCCNNRYLYVNRPQSPQCELSFVDLHPPAERSYYYVRVILKDEEIAWSSPVWFVVGK